MASGGSLPHSTAPLGSVLDGKAEDTAHGIKLEEEMVTFKEDIPSCSPLEDTCTVYVQGDDIKSENTETKSKYLILFYGGGG